MLQVAGLKHHEDMKVRIPRPVCEQILQIVRSAALALFGWDPASNDAPHIRAMGSFLRGKNGTSVSILFAPWN